VPSRLGASYWYNQDRATCLAAGNHRIRQRALFSPKYVSACANSGHVAERWLMAALYPLHGARAFQT